MCFGIKCDVTVIESVLGEKRDLRIREVSAYCYINEAVFEGGFSRLAMGDKCNRWIENLEVCDMR